MTLPGMQPLIMTPYVAPLVPKSFVFNGVDEYLSRALVTSGASTTIFTYSLWVKVVAYASGEAALWTSEGNATDYIFSDIEFSGDEFGVSQDSTDAAGFEEFATGLTPDIAAGTWEHLLIRYDSTQGTAANRLRLYIRGAQVADNAIDQPSASQAHRLFTNGYSHFIGTDDIPPNNSGSKKLAFIDVLEGVSADATAFGFNNGGTWTRKPYVGSRGTYGFSLDGTDGFNDVSGNGMHFTGNNMDVSNLDAADLPPYVMV